MAKVNERDRYEYGVCINRDYKDGKPCPKYDSKEIQKTRKTTDFVCEECKEAMRRVPAPKPPTPWSKIAAIIAAAIVIIGGAAAYFIFGKSEPKQILVSSISLNETSITLNEGESISLQSDISPIDAENKTTVWSSSDSTVVTVSAGNIKALKAGVAVIKVETVDGSLLSADCEVTVKKGVPLSETNDAGLKKGDDKTNSAPSSLVTKETISTNGGRYTGETKGGKAHGQGTLTYSSRTRISMRDMKERYAESGEYVVGEFHEGNLVHGTLYNANNEPIEHIRIGR